MMKRYSIHPMLMAILMWLVSACSGAGTPPISGDGGTVGGDPNIITQNQADGTIHSQPVAGSITIQFTRFYGLQLEGEKLPTLSVLVKRSPAIGAPTFTTGQVTKFVPNPNAPDEQIEVLCTECESPAVMVRAIECPPMEDDAIKQVIPADAHPVFFQDVHLAFLALLHKFPEKLCPNPRYQDFFIGDLDGKVHLESLAPQPKVYSNYIFFMVPNHQEAHDKYGAYSQNLKEFDSASQFSATLTSPDTPLLRSVRIVPVKVINFQINP